MDLAPGFPLHQFGVRRRELGRGYYYCSTTGGDPITGPTSLSTEDLSGLPAGADGTWTCTAVPLEEVSHYGMKTLQVLERLGFDLFL